MSSHDVHVVVPTTLARASLTSDCDDRSAEAASNSSNNSNNNNITNHGRRWPGGRRCCCWRWPVAASRHGVPTLVSVFVAFLLLVPSSLVLIVCPTLVPRPAVVPLRHSSSSASSPSSFFYFFSSLPTTTAATATMTKSSLPSVDSSTMTASATTTVSPTSSSSSFSPKFSSTTAAAITPSTTTSVGYNHTTDDGAERSSRSPRAASSNNNNNNNNREFRILALLPDEYGPNIVRMLRDSQASWEKSGIVSGLSKLPALDGYNNINHGGGGWRRRGNKLRLPTTTPPPSQSSAARSVLRAADMPLSIVSEPVNNDTERLMGSVGNWVTTHQPVLMLSFLDRARNFYAQLVARAAGVPIVSMTRTYQDQFDSQLYSRRGGVKPPKLTRLSLDPPISTLADATFQLLREQYWFDAILIVDDSVVSDQLARRLSSLCRANGFNTQTPAADNAWGKSYGDDWRRQQDKMQLVTEHAHRDMFVWSNFQSSNMRKGMLRDDYLRNMDENDLNAFDNGEVPPEDARKSKEASLMDVWKKLIIIRVSRSMAQNELYLRMAEIQTTHRRVVMVHCDLQSTRRVMSTARELDLYNGDNIWLLLDGLLDPKESFESDTFATSLQLPNGLLALRNQHRAAFDAARLDSVVQLLGRSALNLALKQKEGATDILSELHKLLRTIQAGHRLSPSRRCNPTNNNDQSGGGGGAVHFRQAADGDEEEEEVELDEESARLAMEYSPIVPQFELLNLVPIDDRSWGSGAATTTTNNNKTLGAAGPAWASAKVAQWRVVGNISQSKATVNTIRYIGMENAANYILYDGGEGPEGAPPLTGDKRLGSNSGRHRFRVVTNIAPPFVIESTKLDNNTCLTGDFCLKVSTNIRGDLVEIFTDFRSQRRQLEGKRYQVLCCAGIAIDLLNAISRDLHFDYDLYLVADGLFGVRKDGKWDGVTADLVNEVAHLSFTAFSTTSTRVQAIDYSVPFFYSGVSCLSMTSNYTDVPLLAFLIPFSYELWAAIFGSLLLTAIAAAIYEWFSPFGLNPWGRQRTKNFSLASALWVMCSLLFSHLVAFKAPKSWPNKVLINVWGAFSVIFLATYTANIAAHFAGLFLVPEVNDFHDNSLMKQRTGTARSSASEGYMMEKYTDLWHHIQRYKVDSFDEGLEYLRSGKLDVLIGDTAILDYFRATDSGCNLRLMGDSIFDDAYAVGMQKGFPFREIISNLILKYNEYGFLDQLHRKWYGRVHCFEHSSLTKPKPLTVRAVAGVFLMLAIGIGVGIVILFAEHFVFKYALPKLRRMPKENLWRSPNLMFFSQKLYRFINTVELVSPHHSAKEIMANLREGQIASLFQKSVKRKAKEEARRRKSKSQFFEMIQEVRKVVQRKQQEQSMEEEDFAKESQAGGANDYDDDELIEFEVDSEAVHNTNANVRATRPSISLEKYDDHEGEIPRERTSAIRFQDPTIIDERKLKKSKKKQAAGVPATTTTKALVSSLKQRPSTSSSTSMRHGGGLPPSSFSGESSGLSEPSHSARRRSSSTDRRRGTLQSCHKGSTSFSLENIFFEGLMSEGITDRSQRALQQEQGHRHHRRTLSFEDLSAIKKELSESSNEQDTAAASMPTGPGSQYYVPGGGELGRRSGTPPSDYSMVATTSGAATRARGVMSRSATTPALASALARSGVPTFVHSVGRIGSSNLSRSTILNLWREGESELLSRLEASLEERRKLEALVVKLQKKLAHTTRPP